MAVLAIDQGTTSTRAIRVDDSGKKQMIRVESHRQFYPRSGWVEHDPEELIKNIRLCIDHSPDITAIGIDNQGESCLAWDAETGQAISPVIVWQDDRTRAQIEALKSRGMEPTILERAGLPLDSYFSAAKLGWIMENIPEAGRLHKQGRLRMGTTDAFFLDRLTGRFATDISTASRTSLMNLAKGTWDKILCKLFNVPMDALPEILPTTADFGNISSNGRLIPVTASVVDQQAALFGHGARNPGDAKITFGTGAFALVVTGTTPFQSPDKGLLPTAAWKLGESDTVYALDGGVFSAGSAVNWAKSLGLFSSFDQINAFDAPAAITRDIVFVPALAGLGCPHWDRTAAGMWLGLSLDTGPLDMMQALLEGIVFRTAEVIREMDRIIPVSDTVSVDGGLTANPYFCQFLSDVLQRNVSVPSFTELTVLGTASLAAGPDRGKGTSPDDRAIYRSNSDFSDGLERFSKAVAKVRQWRSC